MKVLKSNWKTAVGVFIAVFLFALVINLANKDQAYSFFQSVVSALIGIVLYGFTSWCLFFVLLLIFELIFAVRARVNLKLMLLAQWICVSSPFVYWSVKYSEWIFVVGVVAFFVTQFMRLMAIRKSQGYSGMQA